MASLPPRLTVSGGRRFKLNKATGPGAFYVRFTRDSSALCHDGTTIMTFNGGHPHPNVIVAVAKCWRATRQRAADAGIGIRPSDGVAGGRMKFKFRAGSPDLLTLEVTVTDPSTPEHRRSESTEPVSIEGLDARQVAAVATGLVESAIAQWGCEVDTAPSAAHLEALVTTWS